MTDFKGFSWLGEGINNFTRQNDFADVESCENVNTQNTAVGRSPIIKTTSSNTFTVTIQIGTYWFIDKQKLSNIKVDKLELTSSYSFIIETNSGILFENPSSEDAINVWVLLLNKCFVKIKDFVEKNLGANSYAIPPQNVILNFARTLGMNELN